MDRKTKGRVAEAQALLWFSEQGYEVYTPFHDNTKYDLLVYKDGLLQRVSVKYCSYLNSPSKWRVTMRNTSRRLDGVHTDKFDPSEYDLIAVYLGEEKRMVVVPATDAGTDYLYINSGR